MTSATSLPPKLRLYREDGTTHPLMLQHLRDPLHRLFGRWVAAHHQVRDFAVALDHTATAMFAEYVFAGAPRFDGEPVPEPVLLTLPTSLSVSVGPPRRFYNDAGELGVSNETLQEQRTVLAPLFLAWSMQNHHERDFVAAVRDAAVALCYDYSVCCALGGKLGGGFTGEQFITTPVRLREIPSSISF